MSELEQLTEKLSRSNHEVRKCRANIKQYKSEIRRIKAEMKRKQLDNFHIVSTKVSDIISAESGIEWSEISSRSKKLELTYCRIIFVHHCRLSGLSSAQSGVFINRKHSDVNYLYGRYGLETDNKFLELAERVKNKLKL